MNIAFTKHNLISRAEDMKDYELYNLEYKEGKIKVKEGFQEGYILSPIFETNKFSKLTGSWCVETKEQSYVELLISVKQNNKMSKFFSYGNWTLGGENLYYNQDDDFVHMNVDEIIMKNNELGDGLQYKLILKGKAEASLVCIALKIPEYKYEVDTKYLPSIVDYNVPKLNQNMVPVIGHEMCSATTTTMLLKFKGMDFSDKDAEFEHRYVAGLVADNGHKAPTFGNWVYNTAVMGAFGYKGYVARMYSWEELKLHLAKVGPVGASIAGDTKLYKTGGHLLVVRGYKEVDGQTYVLCNDPNINSRFGEGLFVYYEYPLEVFTSFWRGVAYVIE